MQKILFTLQYVLGALRQRIVLSNKAWLLASVALIFWTGLLNPVHATDFYKNFVIINGNSSGNTYYYAKTNNNGAPTFQGQNLGSYDRSTGSLVLGAEANTISTNGDDVQPPQMFYRVYLRNTTPSGSFAPLNLGFVQQGLDGDYNNRKWNNVTTQPNLLAGTNGPGNYVLEVYFQGKATYNNSGGSGSFNFYDSNNSNNYQAYFTVTGSVPVQWTGNVSGDWFNTENWDPKTVPTPTTDATIPFIVQGNRPNVGYGVAQVRTLTVNGSPTIPGSLSLSITGGELQVFGDFINSSGNVQQTGGIFTLAGTTQTFDGGTFYDVRIQGGGRKTLRNRLVVLNTLTFPNGGGVLVTRTDNTTSFNVDLSTTGVIGELITGSNGESESSYVLGVLRSNRVFNQSQNYSNFGGIGVELTVTGGAPGNVPVARITGPDSFSYQGAGTSHSIRRGFVFQPDNPDNNTFNLTFRYLDNELSNIKEENLRLFRSLNGSIPFSPLGMTSEDAGSNIFTRTGITGTLAATFTLGDVTAPLPVTLISFTASATAQGAALLRWATASELNNEGFTVERQLGSSSADWQAVGTVAATGLLTGSTYEFTDKSLTTAPAGAVAYYRLRQVDHDGTAAYSPVVALARPAAVGAGELALYPVPVSGSSLSVALAEASQAGLEVAVTNTQGQRLLQLTTQASADAAAISVPVASLAPGVYIVSVRVPGQSVRHARFVKL